MKKLVIIALVLSSTAAFATSDTTTVNQSTVIALNETEKPVKQEELPQAVKDTLSKAPYADWKVEQAFWGTTEAGEYYRIELSKADVKQSVKLTKEGQLVK